MAERHEVKALLVDVNKLLVYPAPGEVGLLPVEIQIDPDILDHLGYFRKHLSLADKIQKVLDSWKEDQHPYMTYEVMKLIIEIEAILSPKSSIQSQVEPLGKDESASAN